VSCHKVPFSPKLTTAFYEKCGFEPRSKGMVSSLPSHGEMKLIVQAYYVPSESEADQDVFGIQSATVPPPSGGATGGVQPLSINTGPPLVIDLNSTVGGNSTMGSPKTYNSGSSSSGVTYSFPVPPGQHTQGQSSSDQSHAAATAPASGIPPTLPPRPLPSRQTSDTHFPPPVTSTTTAAYLLSPSSRSASLSSDQDRERGRDEGRVSSPTALEVTLDAPTTPAWAAEGLGSSEKTRLLPVNSSIGSLKEQVGAGSMLGSVVPNVGERRVESPLPPGAAPAMTDEEPERIVESRG